MTAPRTLTELFFTAVEQHRGKPAALVAKHGPTWQGITHDEVLRRVRALSLALEGLGVMPGDRLAIVSGNRPDWLIADYACLTSRCAAVAVYPTLPASQQAFILADSGASVVFVEDMVQLAKVREIRAQLPALRHVIAFDGSLAREGVTTIDELIARGEHEASRDAGWRARALAAEPGDLATLIYTSGTTGDPKGVMLTHGNFTSNIAAGLQVLQITADDDYLSFLPLSHVFERMLHFAMFHVGATLTYARSPETVADDMRDRRPTLLASVPRLYDKIQARVIEGAAASPLRRRILQWAMTSGAEWSRRTLDGGGVSPWLGLQHALADRLVFSKIRARTGGRIRYFISGGAPLRADIGRFFHAAGLPIVEGYGLTETSPVISANPLTALRIGTVGRPIPGVEVRLAADGEIQTRGPHVMLGYWQRPDATANAIDADGWFSTGDIGTLDDEGYLRITDRKKDLIVTAGGKNIAPQPLELRIKRSPFIVNAIMLGDGRKYPILIVVPELDRLRTWARERSLVCASNDAALVASPETYAKLESEVAAEMGDVASFERPKKLLVVADDFTVERGELTPTLKVKRRLVEVRLSAEIDALYANGDGVAH